MLRSLGEVFEAVVAAVAPVQLLTAVLNCPQTSFSMVRATKRKTPHHSGTYSTRNHTLQDTNPLKFRLEAKLSSISMFILGVLIYKSGSNILKIANHFFNIFRKVIKDVVKCLFLYSNHFCRMACHLFIKMYSRFTKEKHGFI